jgi:DNA-binding NtrC family response regulator
MAHILFIEPDQNVADIMQKYFQEKAPDLSVSFCNDAQSAISQADEQKPDLVVLELAVPNQNGIAFLQEFRSYTDWLDVPVIIHSHIPADNTGLTRSEWQKYRVAAYLYKPTTRLEDLLRTINQQLTDEAAQR